MVTIRDVARLAGVSMTTVSRAFNEHTVIKAATRQRILQVARETGYVPNYNARSLVTNKKYTLGIFFSTLTDGTSQSFLSAIINAAYRIVPENYLLTVNGINRIDSVADMVASRMDGVIIVSQSEKDAQFIYEAKSLHIPLVVINRQLNDTSIANVTSDDAAGVHLGLDYVAQCGHKKVGMIQGKAGFTSALLRRQGFDQGVIDNHLIAVPEAIRSGDYSSQTGQAQMAAILALPADIRPTCVICANDDMAIGALRACYLAGLHLPDDMSVLGFDGSFYASMHNPAITTIAKPIGDMVALAITHLMEQIDTPELPKLHLRLPPRLVVRESIARLNREG